MKNYLMALGLLFAEVIIPGQNALFLDKIETIKIDEVEFDVFKATVTNDEHLDLIITQKELQKLNINFCGYTHTEKSLAQAGFDFLGAGSQGLYAGVAACLVSQLVYRFACNGIYAWTRIDWDIYGDLPYMTRYYVRGVHNNVLGAVAVLAITGLGVYYGSKAVYNLTHEKYTIDTTDIIIPAKSEVAFIIFASVNKYASKAYLAYELVGKNTIVLTV